MANQRLRRIDFLFPNATAEPRAFFADMELLFSRIPGAALQAGRILLTPTHDSGALPTSSLQSVDVEYPQVVFETEELIDVRIGRLHLRSTTGSSREGTTQASEMPQADDRLLPAKELCRRLDGRVPRVDHVGVNLPTESLDRERWGRLIETMSSISTLYRYPDNHDWLFALPASEDEFQNGIENLVAGRTPKFELVYDDKVKLPLFQFSLTTDLSRAESEELFPGPSGVALDGVGQYFRSVFLEHPWPGLTIRFDLYYRDVSAEWVTSKLLVDAGRVRPSSGWKTC